MGENKPRYTWRKTWADVAEHFCGYDGDRRFAAIHSHHMVGWEWFMNLHLPWANGPSADPRCGYCETAREAACAAEACYDAVMAGVWPGMSPKDIESAGRLRRNEG